jgi:hypothetical protein
MFEHEGHEVAAARGFTLAALFDQAFARFADRVAREGFARFRGRPASTVGR